MAIIKKSVKNEIMRAEIELIEPVEGESDFGSPNYLVLTTDSFSDCSFSACI